MTCLLAKGFLGLTAWDFAGGKGRKEILEKLWGWGKEVQVNHKITCCLPKVLMDKLLGTEQQ